MLTHMHIHQVNSLDATVNIYIHSFTMMNAKWIRYAKEKAENKFSNRNTDRKEVMVRQNIDTTVQAAICTNN